jgi:hypothetical protein
MAHIQNQNILHTTIDGKKTLCSLSNQYKMADSIQEFKTKLINQSWIKYCCKKCQSTINAKGL